jgi:hypothetical protein
VINIELWGGPVDGHVMQVDSLRPVWHVPMIPTATAFGNADDLMALADGLDVLQHQTAVYEREWFVASKDGHIRYLYRGMLAG